MYIEMIPKMLKTLLIFHFYYTQLGRVREFNKT